MDKQAKKAVRIALLVLSLLNIALASAGLSPIQLDSQALTNFINDGWAIGMALWSCWKNCSVTKPHLEADKVAEAIRDGAEVVIKYRYGGEGAEDGDEIEHEMQDPEDAEV